MDNFSMYGIIFHHCLNNLSKISQRCEDMNLVLNWEKCHIMVYEGVVLGYIASNRGIEVDNAKVEAIENRFFYEGCKEHSWTSWFLLTVHKRFFEICKTSHPFACQRCAF